MEIDPYLERIGYDGPVEPSESVLFGVHRAHIDRVAYENLAIHLGHENTLVEADFLDKIVTRRRGGWCYEMNGTLQWALRKLGFQVTRASGAVAREIIGDDARDNHLIGFVDLDRRYVVDVGLGDGPSDPFPLEERTWSEGPLEFRLERLDEDQWRFHNHQHGMAPSFDFTEEPRELPSFQHMCTMLQTVEWSPFVTYAMVIRRTPDGFRAVRDTTLLEANASGKQEREISSLEEYTKLLGELVGQRLDDDAGTLWDAATVRATQRAADAGEKG